MKVLSRSIISDTILVLTILSHLSGSAIAQQIVQLTAETFREGIENGRFDAIVDVRSQTEWDSGHIEGATLVADLANAGTISETTNFTELAGCEYCQIVVYCNSGARAGVAIRHLAANGFQYLYNGLGVVQWQNAGNRLLDAPSVEPECTLNELKSEECFAAFQSEMFSPAPSLPSSTRTSPPSSSPTSAPRINCVLVNMPCNTDAECCQGTGSIRYECTAKRCWKVPRQSDGTDKDDPKNKVSNAVAGLVRMRHRYLKGSTQ